MSLLDDAFNAVNSAFKAVNGVVSGVQDAGKLADDVVSLNVHRAVTDGRKIFGDVGDVLEGLEGLGVNLGKVSSEAYKDSPFGKLADSPILAAAQLAITAMRATTGSGNPEEGNGFSKSAVHLEKALNFIIDAKPHDDRWDGAASQQYQKKNHSHQHATSDAQVADRNIGQVIATEAGQVARTRKTLDEASQDLYDYGLATAWLNFVPGGAVVKAGLDMAAAAAALTTAEATMTVLVADVLENASRIRQNTELYKGAVDEEMPEGDSCDPFPNEDPPGAPKPKRLNPGYHEVPAPIEPMPEYPSATPYGAPSTAPGPTGQFAPVPAPEAPVAGAPAAPSSFGTPAPAAAQPAVPSLAALSPTAPTASAGSPAVPVFMTPAAATPPPAAAAAMTPAAATPPAPASRSATPSGGRPGSAEVVPTGAQAGPTAGEGAPLTVTVEATDDLSPNRIVPTAHDLTGGN